MWKYWCGLQQRVNQKAPISPKSIVSLTAVFFACTYVHHHADLHSYENRKVETYVPCAAGCGVWLRAVLSVGTRQAAAPWTMCAQTSHTSAPCSRCACDMLLTAKVLFVPGVKQHAQQLTFHCLMPYAQRTYTSAPCSRCAHVTSCNDFVRYYPGSIQHKQQTTFHCMSPASADCCALLCTAVWHSSRGCNG
jgi:hypothetical protein